MAPHVFQQKYLGQHLLVDIAVGDILDGNMEEDIPVLADGHLLESLVPVHQQFHSPLEHMATEKLIPQSAHQQTVQLLLREGRYSTFIYLRVSFRRDMVCMQYPCSQQKFSIMIRLPKIEAIMQSGHKIIVELEPMVKETETKRIKMLFKNTLMTLKKRNGNDDDLYLHARTMMRRAMKEAWNALECPNTVESSCGSCLFQEYSNWKLKYLETLVQQIVPPLIFGGVSSVPQFGDLRRHMKRTLRRKNIASIVCTKLEDNPSKCSGYVELHINLEP